MGRARPQQLGDLVAAAQVLARAGGDVRIVGPDETERDRIDLPPTALVFSAGHDVLVIEVMIEALDRAWWRAFREQLEKTFRQTKVIVRVQTIELL